MTDSQFQLLINQIETLSVSVRMIAEELIMMNEKGLSMSIEQDITEN